MPMSDHWIPIALCSESGFIGWLIVYGIQYYQFAWFMLSGMTYVYRKMWVTFLCIYGWLEELFYWWMLSHQFQQHRPVCNLVYDPTFENDRRFGMPSIEAQLTFSLAVFVVGNLLFTGIYPPKYTFFSILALPILISAAMWITHNNTVFQIFIGALVGTLNGLRRVVTYQFFLKKGLVLLSQTFKPVQWILPDKDD